MAEVLGIVASGISVAQLAGQVAHSLVRLKGYWDQVKDAPEEISTLIHDLELFNVILLDLEQEDVQTQICANQFPNPGFRQALTLCKEAAKELKLLADTLNRQTKLESRLRSTRGAVKFVLKKDQIKRFKARLKRAISLLQLSNQCYTRLTKSLRALFRIQFNALATLLSNTQVAKGDNLSTKDLTQDLLTEHTMTEDSSKAKSVLPFTISKTSLSIVDSDGASHIVFRMPLVGSVLFSKHAHQRRKIKNRGLSRSSQFQIVAQYRSPFWLSYKAWQLCYYRAQMGWTCNLSTYNIIPDISRQFRCAKAGRLTELQNLVSSRRASIFDQTEAGDTMLSLAAQRGHVDVCRWLLQQGAPTDHRRFGSVLQEVLYYGAWMSFQRGIPMLEIVRLLQSESDYDFFDCPDTKDGHCSFYGRKEVLEWLLKNANSSGCCSPTNEQRVKLALNIARNIDHNGPQLVEVVLGDIDSQTSCRFKDAEGITLLHRVASRLGGTFAYEAQRREKSTQFLDDGFTVPDGPSAKDLLARDGWLSFLRQQNLDGADLHAVSLCRLSPLAMGLRTLSRVWVGSTSQQLHALSAFLRLWLAALGSLGVNLQAYGAEEARLQREGFVDQEFHRHRRVRTARGTEKSAFAVDETYGAVRLIGFTPHAAPEAWCFWWAEPTDEFLRDFWRMVEHVSASMPGAWCDESGWV